MTKSGLARILIAATIVVVGGVLAIMRLDASRTSDEATRLAAVLRVTAGSRVADVGAGSGTYTLDLARRVGPTGHVFATEVESKRLKQIDESARRAGLTNVTVIEAGEADSRLPDRCCDAIFLRDVYHHLIHPAAIDESLFRALSPGGRLAVIDFRPNRFLSWFFPVRGVPANRGGHGVPPEVVEQELSKAGFVLDERIDKWRGSQYCRVFSRSRSPVS